MKRFYDVRKSALESWASLTRRQLVDEFGELSSDDFASSYECNWQNLYDDGHVNLFCSFGEWGSNITDILKETRYDHLDLLNENENKVLFRFYTRFLLVVSEMLTDFQDIYLHTEKLECSKSNQNIARKFYSIDLNTDTYTPIFNYINRVCKHKTQHIHVCNNHNKIVFEDGGQIPLELNYIHLGDIKTDKNKDAILIPHLHYFINILGLSYFLLDEYFKTNSEKFNELCSNFKSQTTVPSSAQ